MSLSAEARGQLVALSPNSPSWLLHQALEVTLAELDRLQAERDQARGDVSTLTEHSVPLEVTRQREAERQTLQATADRRGELLRRARHALELHDEDAHVTHWKCLDTLAAIVAELAGEGDGS